jgi:hypothetical protein
MNCKAEKNVMYKNYEQNDTCLAEKFPYENYSGKRFFPKA